MNQNPKQLIIQILNIIGYEKDKEKFAEEYWNICIENVIFKLISNFDDNKKIELQNKISLLKQNDNIEKLLLEYFSEDEYKEAVKTESQTMFVEYINTLLPTLNEEQVKKLQEFLASNSSE
jgi:hypothetical protein